MNILTLENISKSYSEKTLMKDINLGINEGEKIGLIGVNGAGKSTLLKIIAGVEVPDDGKRTLNKSMTVEYLPQNPEYDPDATVIEQVFKHTSKDDAREHEAKIILTKLGIFDFDARMGNLSGGQKKRVALAGALISPCQLLILDEPTNHMDDESITWLEQYLNRRNGALVMITHDRYFLDRVTNRILELSKGNLYSYEGNYSVFLEKRIEREELMNSLESKRQNLLRKELEWVKRGAKARSTKQKARLDRFEKLKEQAFDTADGKVEISVGSTRLGGKVIEMSGVSKSFEGRKVIDDFSYIVLKDDRVGIIGPNGAGKSTLMNIMCGSMAPDSGTVDIGSTVKIGYFSQETSHMDDSMRVIDYVREGAEFISTADGTKISASQMLERFLFAPSEQYNLIGKLSGGERRRLFLLRVLMEAPNVLLLDEPTNDLDIETLAILEDYLEDFPGAVITVSHDRYFLDRMANKMFAFEGDGRITQYTGNYIEYLQLLKESNEKQKETRSKEEKSKGISSDNSKKERPLKFSYKEQKEFDEIDSVISGLEARIEEKEKEIQANSTDFVLLQQLMGEKEDLEKTLEEKMDRWMYLNELAEKIESQKKGR